MSTEDGERPKEASKPLIEKRRRARINKALDELIKMVAKPMSKRENRMPRFEKAVVLEMTVEYVKKAVMGCIIPDRPSYSVYNIAFQNGFKRCSEEVQHFLQNGCDNFPEDSLLKPLMKHLNQKQEASSSNSRVPADLAQLGSTKNPVTQPEVSGNSTDYHSKISIEVFSPNSNKSDYSSMDSFSRVSRPSSDDSTGYHPNMNNEVLNSNSNKSDYSSADSCSRPSVYESTGYFPKTTKRLLDSNCNKLDYSSRDSGSSASRPSSEYVTGYHPMKKRVLSSNSNTLNYPLMDYGSRASRPSSEDESPHFHNLVSEISIKNKEINFGPKMVAQNEELKENMINIVQDVGDEDGIENVINSVLNVGDIWRPWN
ncbi:BHLH domain-containing protein [Nephila pilipes]|uniref:BHLH domain-containing protein n=1 Tax=Nephila pilipes TaxID=299642 RepID=A0A8X6MJF8_NEPPI|nr:BHLH domain-containing protein [Nephila pilipes]